MGNWLHVKRQENVYKIYTPNKVFTLKWCGCYMHFLEVHSTQAVRECFNLKDEYDLLPTVDLQGLNHKGNIMPEGKFELQKELINRYSSLLLTSNLSKC